MVQAIINVDDHTNRLLNIIKAKFGLKNKSEAIETMANQYEEYILDPELRPEYIEKAEKIAKQKTVPVEDFAKRYGVE